MTLSDRFILAAKEHGYTASKDGGMFRPDGKEVKGTPLRSSGHLRVTVYVPSLNARGFASILKHRFIAYFFLGEDALRSPLIRHLNDTPTDNRIENLVPGTSKENRADVPREKISAPAKLHAHKLVSRSRKLSDPDVLHMRAIRLAQGLSYQKLAELFGVTAMTAHRAVNFQSWSNI